jgi:hypothetical protein
MSLRRRRFLHWKQRSWPSALLDYLLPEGVSWIPRQRNWSCERFFKFQNWWTFSFGFKSWLGSLLWCRITGVDQSRIHGFSSALFHLLRVTKLIQSRALFLVIIRILNSLICRFLPRVFMGRHLTLPELWKLPLIETPGIDRLLEVFWLRLIDQDRCDIPVYHLLWSSVDQLKSLGVIVFRFASILNFISSTLLGSVRSECCPGH